MYSSDERDTNDNQRNLGVKARWLRTVEFSLLEWVRELERAAMPADIKRCDLHRATFAPR